MAVDASNTIIKPSWTDYNILFDMDVASPWRYESSWNYFRKSIENSSCLLNATMVVDNDATLVFEYYHSSIYTGVMEVYLDDVLQYTINKDEGNTQQRYFVEMDPGRHCVTWKFTSTDNSDYCRISNIGVEQTSIIEVSLLEPGSLGTEVLKNTDHIQNVRKLTISGEMNSDDWEKIMMMNSLFSLDLTNAIITEIPERQLSRGLHDNLSFFHKIKLPLTLKTIGNAAFSSTYLDEIE